MRLVFFLSLFISVSSLPVGRFCSFCLWHRNVRKAFSKAAAILSAAINRAGRCIQAKDNPIMKHTLLLCVRIECQMYGPMLQSVRLSARGISCGMLQMPENTPKNGKRIAANFCSDIANTVTAFFLTHSVIFQNSQYGEGDRQGQALADRLRKTRASGSIVQGALL